MIGLIVNKIKNNISGKHASGKNISHLTVKSVGEEEMIGIIEQDSPIRRYLRSKNIVPDSTYNDYQDYIESKQEAFNTELVYSDQVSARGSMHLALGLVMSSKTLEKLWKRK